MAKDTKNVKKSSGAASGATPPWIWMLTGFVLGIVVSLAVYFRGGSELDVAGPGGGQAVPGSGDAVAEERRQSWVSSLLAFVRGPAPQGPAEAAGGSAERSGGDEPRGGGDFEFYTLLPDLEVTIPEEGAQRRPPGAGAGTPTKPRSGSQSAPSPDSRGRYMLQAGSFRQFSEADGLRARLALLGVEARIQEVRVGKTTFHRVRVGPYQAYSDAAQIQEILKRNRVDSLLMKSGG